MGTKNAQEAEDIQNNTHIIVKHLSRTHYKNTQNGTQQPHHQLADLLAKLLCSLLYQHQLARSPPYPTLPVEDRWI